MKKKTILIVVFVLVLGLFLFFYRILTTKIEPTSTGTPAKPSFPKHVDEGFNITSSLNESDFAFPESVPLVVTQKGKALTEAEVFSIVEQANFPREDYVVAEDREKGRAYIFRDRERSLTIFLESNKITYISGVRPTTAPSLSDENLTKNAEDFLKQNFLVGSGDVFFSSVDYLLKTEEFTETSTREKANLFKINFTPIKLEIKLIGANPSTSDLSVWVLPDGQIAKAEIVRMPKIALSEQEVQIKTYSEVLSSLSQATLISLADGKIYPRDLPQGSIANVDVSKIEIAYYNDPSLTFYQPIFILNGVANVGNLGSLPAVLYLPAAKGL